jgi:hypothetical protein
MHLFGDSAMLHVWKGLTGDNIYAKLEDCCKIACSNLADAQILFARIECDFDQIGIGLGGYGDFTVVQRDGIRWFCEKYPGFSLMVPDEALRILGLDRTLDSVSMAEKIGEILVKDDHNDAMGLLGSLQRILEENSRVIFVNSDRP